MQTEKLLKPVPRSIAIFGAGGRMGREVAAQLSYLDPGITLRLIASSEEGAATLRGQQPGADIRVANYFDPATLGPALDGMEAIFVVTPPGLDERTAMTNLVDAVRAADSAIQIIRLVGYAPEWNPKKYPWDTIKTGGEHFIAREVLEDSDLPVTYVNLGASLFDNMFFTRGGIRREHKLIWPQREVPMMDVRDLGAVIARLFLSDDARYIGSFLTINNGYDYLSTQDLAKAMSDAFLTPISFETSREAFLAEYGPLFTARFGAPDQAEILLDYFDWEHDNWLWQLNDTAEKILGRRPTTLHSWLVEHRPVFLAEG